MKSDYLATIKNWQAAGQKIVLVTGVFDLLHVEHFRFLEKAQAEGDKLVVGIESDRRVMTMKGDGRPVNNQMIRQEQLQALRPVDLVFILPEQFDHQADWDKLLTEIKPVVYCVSSHTSHLDNKRATCDRLGILFAVVYQYNPEYSTSKILEKLNREL